MFIYKYHNIQETAFWQFFFSNFSAFHSATIQHFTNTIERGLNLRRNSTSTRAHVLFSVYYVCYNCSTSVINASIEEFGRVSDWYIFLLFYKYAHNVIALDVIS